MGGYSSLHLLKANSGLSRLDTTPGCGHIPGGEDQQETGSVFRQSLSASKGALLMGPRPHTINSGAAGGKG